MSSSSAISGGIGNSGISVDELVYLEWDISMPTPFDGTHLVLYVKYMQTFCKTWLGISLKLTWKKIMSDWKTNAVHLICLIFCKLSRTREHGLDSAWKSQVNFQEGPAVSQWSWHNLRWEHGPWKLWTHVHQSWWAWHTWSEEWVAYKKQDPKLLLNKLHCIRAFAASKGSCFTTYVHCRVAGSHFFLSVIAINWEWKWFASFP